MIILAMKFVLVCMFIFYQFWKKCNINFKIISILANNFINTNIFIPHENNILHWIFLLHEIPFPPQKVPKMFDIKKEWFLISSKKLWTSKFEEKGEYGRIWGEKEENGATESAIYCTICKKGWVGIGHEMYQNSGIVLCQHPGRFSLDCRGYRRSRRSPAP